MAYRTLDDLDKIISSLNTLSNQAQKRESKRYSRDSAIYDDFASDLDTTYSNDRLNVLESRVDDYINRHSGQFNDLSVENFALLKEKIQHQREDNTAYESGYDKLEKYAEANYKLVDDFKTVQGLTPDEDGFIEFDIDGEKKKIRKDDWLIQQKKYMQNHARGYLDAQDNFSLQFGGEKGRLTNLSQREKLIRINNFDEVFRFGIDSIADEFLDDAEYEAYTNAFLYKDKKYIDEFQIIREGQQSSIRKYHEDGAINTFETVNYNLRLLDELDMLQDLTAKVNGQGAYENISNEDRRAAKTKLDNLKQTTFPIEQKGETAVTYAELISDDDTIDTTSGLYTTLQAMQKENRRLAIEMGKRNKVYMQSSKGQSLGDLGFSFNDDGLSVLAGFRIEPIQQQGATVTPGISSQQQIEKVEDDEDVKTVKPYNTRVVDLGESSEAQRKHDSWVEKHFPDSKGILPEPINIEKELSLLTVTYPSAEAKVKEWGEEYNKLHESYRNFSIDDDVELKTAATAKKWNLKLAPLNNILGRDEKTPLSKEDIVKLRQIYDNDLAEIEKLKSHKEWLKTHGKRGVRITSAFGWEDDINEITRMYREIESKWIGTERHKEERTAIDFLNYAEDKMTRKSSLLFQKYKNFKDQIGKLQ